MNAAVETSRTETQRRRTLSSQVKVRSAAGDMEIDASQALPVLIRVPNLDAPRAATRTAAKAEESIAAKTDAETTSRKSERTNNHSNSTPAATPAASATGNLIGWLWRMTILAAAVGLVVLAYRIINGPAQAPEMDALPANMNVVAGSGDAEMTPFATPPAPLAPQASDIAAPSTLAPPQLELETPPVQVSPVDINATADQSPTSSDKNVAQREAEMPRDERRPWASEVQMEQPRSDGSIRTARSDWDSGWGGSGSGRQPQPTDESQYQDAENWDNTDQPAPSFDYPETSPNSWRDDGRWESTPRNAPPRNNGAAAPAWNEPAHSAMRPREPGVARLHGEIEQPPLRRDDERNRPSVY